MIITTMVLEFLVEKKPTFHSNCEQRSDVSDTEVPVKAYRRQAFPTFFFHNYPLRVL